MAIREKPSILLTNDDGIRSPGLWAAAEALSELGFVTVVAPRAQSSGSGRSMPITSDGVICEVQVEIRGKTWKVYAVGGSPAQAVQHGIFEITEGTPDLVVAGINYGENVGTGVPRWRSRCRRRSGTTYRIQRMWTSRPLHTSPSTLHVYS
jgi:5'-nucleotidase